jgi:hypothetical protein
VDNLDDPTVVGDEDEIAAEERDATVAAARHDERLWRQPWPLIFGPGSIVTVRYDTSDSGRLMAQMSDGDCAFEATLDWGAANRLIAGIDAALAVPAVARTQRDLSLSLEKAWHPLGDFKGRTSQIRVFRPGTGEAAIRIDMRGEFHGDRISAVMADAAAESLATELHETLAASPLRGQRVPLI